MVGVPVIAPGRRVGIVRPAGRPVADPRLMVAVDGRVGRRGRHERVTAVPETFAWLPGLVTVTVLVMVQVKVAQPRAGAVGDDERDLDSRTPWSACR